MELQIPHMDLEQIAASGQCFRMEKKPDGRYSIIAGKHYLNVQQKEDENGNFRFAFSCTEEEFQTFWKYYFDLERNYGELKQRIDPQDWYLRRAADFGWGIRILRQDLWEMIITFIISQQNNIPRIRRCVRLLCEKYGTPLCSAEGDAYFSFPAPEKLASATVEELLACNLGYRGKYIQKTAQMIADGSFNLQALRQMLYEEAKKELMKLCGVGVKVAECVCLFALHHVEAFPVDTHIAQVLTAHYSDGFPFGRYPGIAGILQQYIFYYELHGDKNSNKQ